VRDGVMTISQQTLDRLKRFAADGDSCATALLFILERLEALEAQPPAASGSETAQVASEADDKVVINCPETCWIEIRRIADGKVIYNNHRRGTLVIPVGEPPAGLPAPAGGLVERVCRQLLLRPAEARAVIHVVAAWLDRYGCHGCSLWLREEADR